MLGLLTALVDKSLVVADDGGLHGAAGGDLMHPGVGLVVLLSIAVLNVYKPRRLTPYGWRKQQEERAARIGPAEREAA